MHIDTDIDTDIDTVIANVRQIDSVPEGCADRAVITAALGAARQVRSWAEGAEARLAAMLAEFVSFPEKDVAAAGRTSLRDAERALKRAATAAAVPGFGAALNAGEVSGDHLDAIGRAMRKVEPSQRDALAAHADTLLPLGLHGTAGDLEAALNRHVRKLQADDGMDRLERQRRNIRVRTWVDPVDGMWCIKGRFDPVNGLRIHNALKRMHDAMFATEVPDTCPTDPFEKQDYLRALALLELADGKGSRGGRPEIIVVVDTTTPQPDGGPTIDWGLPVEIPDRVLLDLFGEADVHTVIVRNGVILYAPGELDLGRTTRIASTAQRRALRAVYRSCAVPGCRCPFDNTKIHHIHYWENGGRTDLQNLIPLCTKHHQAVHNDGWVLIMRPDRSLTIILPDGTLMTTGPPNRRAA